MEILVTGAAGFLGTRLVTAILGDRAAWPGLARIVCADLAACPVTAGPVASRVGSIADPAFARSLVGPETRVVFHLAAVVSGQAEAEFDLGMGVNVDATRLLLDACRAHGRRPRFVFSSTVAVFGGAMPPAVTDDQAPWPQSSYGAEKVMGETLVTEYSRREWVDGVACRLPTVAVRPGAPNAAVSSFVSGIVREPLNGVDTVCPVPLDTPLWIASPDTTVANLLHAARCDTGRLTSHRVINLPGLSTTPAAMLESLERIGGPAARARVRVALDPTLGRIVRSWPGGFETRRATALGFTADASVDAIVQQFADTRRG
jgi:nucleoside-diphosphate-sugar epimerase